MEAHQALKSFIEYTKEDHFPLESIPFGVFSSSSDAEPHCCTRVSNKVIDLSVLVDAGFLKHALKDGKNIFKGKYLNCFIDLGKQVWHETRVELQQLFGDGEDSLKDSKDLLEKALFEAD